MRAIALAALLLPACSALDRESYSLVFRKKAHRYQEAPPVESERKALQQLPDEYAEDRLPPPADFREAGAFLEKERADAAFVPFAYCRLHRSSHVPESLTAVALAPLEYSLAFVGNLGAGFVRGLGEWIRSLFPPERKDPPRDPVDLNN